MSRRDQTENVVLTRKEVASRLKIREQLLRDWAYQRFGPPFIKVGTLVRYPLDKLIQWEQENTQLASCRLSDRRDDSDSLSAIA